MKYLSKIRILLSIIMFILLSLTFLDYYKLIPASFKKGILCLQLLPSLLNFTNVLSIAGTGFIIILLVTFLFGRIYCSFICPLGFCQDIFSAARSLFKKRRNFSYSEPHYILFYSILCLCILSFFISGTILIIWLDPFSIFGRFMTYAASHAFFSLNNIFASILIEKNIFIVNSFNIVPSLAGAVFAISVFTVIMTLSFFRGRLYCNSLCPAGALLSLIAKVSVFKISIDKTSCTHCGRCEKLCKSSCIDYAKLKIDFSRCVSCYNCISQCHTGSIGYNIDYLFKAEKNTEKNRSIEAEKNGTITRLKFISGLMLLPVSLAAQKKNETLYYEEPSKQKKHVRKYYSSPPGSLSIELFNSRCTACSLCISICPTSVLQPAVMQYGLSGIMQPFMDFDSGYCNYDCILCAEICPTGALQKISIDEKKLVQTGKSFFIKENCITYTNGTDCGACSEHCPTKAVHMVPFKNNLVIPEVHTDICTGCGACEHVCPVRPNKAIYVDGNKKHLLSKSPIIEKKKQIIEQKFPF